MINHFVAVDLDRAGIHRKDEAWISAALAARSTRFLVLWREQQLLVAQAGAVRPAYLTPRALDQLFDADAAIFLGLDRDGSAMFALDVTVDDPLPALGIAVADDGILCFQPLRSSIAGLTGPDAALLAYARGMVNWHLRHRFCGVCGAPAKSVEGGHVRQCTGSDCRAQHFPRTDPAVIMLVTDGDRCLLGRQKIWPAGMHSVLAGFVEPGESLEEAVAREVLEEAGVRVDEVTYHSSQPWPFPASIMLGFTARAVTTDIHVDTAELESAAWYSRAWLRAQTGDGGFHLPASYSIASRLIADWLSEGTGSPQTIGFPARNG